MDILFCLTLWVLQDIFNYLLFTKDNFDHFDLKIQKIFLIKNIGIIRFIINVSKNPKSFSKQKYIFETPLI